MLRPVGVSAGGLGMLLAWLGGAAIARVTGASAVVIVLAAGVVLVLAAIVDGCVTTLRTRLGAVTLPPHSTQGRPVTLDARVRAPRPVWLEVRSAGRTVASGWSTTTGWTAAGTFERRGRVDRLEVRLRSAGALGLVWWGRRCEVDVEPHLVAPPALAGDVVVDRTGMASDGDLAGASGAISGEIDGLRPWRDGDSEKFVHWTSSLRGGELMVHDRRHDADRRWIVRARSGTGEPDREAGAARRVIEQGLRSGATVGVAVDDGTPEPVEDLDAAVEWAALTDLGDHREHGEHGPAAGSPRLQFPRVEPDETGPPSARWWSATATAIALLMLSAALGYSAVAIGAILVGVAAGAAVSARSLVTGAQPSVTVRAFVGLGAVGCLVVVLASAVDVSGLLAVLRGPLPQLLVALVLLHGFECRDRRTVRVSLGISAVVVMYASGLSVDPGIGWWLLAWCAAFGVALTRLAGPTVSSAPRPAVAARAGVPMRRVAVGASGVAGGLAATVAVLVLVPVPDGPARLTLPTLIQDAEPVGAPGSIVGPDGTSPTADADAAGDRAPAGQAGGYVGFADSMDTSVRGDLGETVVMRVRAPEPDFWRGQTFATFDGRRWYADEAVGDLLEGPDMRIPTAFGDRTIPDAGSDVTTDRFVQTYFLDVDMPNVIFQTGRARRVVAETDVWARPDGALRASTVIPAGSIYTVVSSRVDVDAATLARQGLIEQRLTARGRDAFAPYLQVPASTSAETVALASRLAAGHRSTYDVIRAYEGWLADHVEYDLDAPVPEPGEDAVHDFLFDSRRGFCEQIASSLTIMLRTRGVPARVAAGYVPGARDRVAGVFEVRAGDAHAWVEVWFPETGWQAFDPTASVPLSADAEIGSVGTDLLAGASTYVSAHRAQVAVLAGIALAAVGLADGVRRAVARRRRGRWGVLQDRFAAVASRRGAVATAPNPLLAEAWAGDAGEPIARTVAERLDRIAFDPAFDDTDEVFDETRRLVGGLRTGAR